MSRGEMSWEEFQQIKAAYSMHKFVVVTASMAPLIPVGAAVAVDGQRIAKRGDIIVFWQADKLICHILWHENRTFLPGGHKLYATRALNAASLDITIKAEQVLGVVISHRLNWYWRLRLYWFDFKRNRRS